MRVCCLSTLEELAPYADDWERLSSGVPFRSWTWLKHWWRSYGPQTEADALKLRLAALCVFDDADALAGVAPWYLECSPLHGRVLRAMGSGEVCSDYLSVLCQRDSSEAVLQTLADYLAENALSDEPDALRWDLLELTGVDAEDRAINSLAANLTQAGCTVHRRPGMNCWRLELPTDWDAYVAGLGKNLRRDVRRLERELLDSGRAVLHAAENLDELPRAMDILLELHQRRRHAVGEAGCFTSARFMAFYHEVVPDLLRRGQVQFYWLELDGKPVAAEYQLVGNGVLYAYQAGVDPDAMQHQPGKLINLAILRRSIARGYRVFDFLRGDEPYKARFGARPRPGMELRIVPHRAAAQLRHNLWLAGENVKHWIKRGFRVQGSGHELHATSTAEP
jgi:CelD/BcsL family acetyltransferase involved in cellulose biosynthesis